MSRRQQHRGTQVTLFPFLTVLLCAMGALIFLFLVITQQIRSDSLAAQQEVVEPQLPKEEPVLEIPEPLSLDEPEPVTPVDPNKPWQELLETLQASYSEAVDQNKVYSNHIKQLKTKLSRFEQKANIVISQQAKLQTELEKQQQASDVLSEEQAKNNSLVTGLQTQIEREQEQARTAQSKYSIVPYDGQLGTVRRPILIECDADSLTFRPEDIVLTAQNVSGYSSFQNPLSAGTKALIEYWEKQDQLNGKETTEPYVLLLVRPSGSVAYYAAKKLLSSLDIQIGYELIPASYPIAWPEKNDEAERVCREAVEEAIKQGPSQINLRMASIGKGNGSREYRKQDYNQEGAEAQTKAEESRAEAGRQMRFDPNTGQFIEIAPPPPTQSKWDRLGVAQSEPNGNPQSTRPMGESTFDQHKFAQQEQAVVENSTKNPFEEKHNPVGISEYEGANQEEPPTLLNLDEPASQLPQGEDEQNGYADQRQMKGQELNALRSIREIDPREQLSPLEGEERAGVSSFDQPASRYSEKQTQQSSGAPASQKPKPWYQTSSTTGGASKTESQATGSSSSEGEACEDCENSPQSSGQASSRFEMPFQLRMERTVNVVVTQDMIRVEDGKTISVGIDRDDEELANEFKTHVSKIVQGWTKSNPRVTWTPYLKFTVLPGGNIPHARLLQQLPANEVNYTTENELTLSTPFSLDDKTMSREEAEKIFLEELTYDLN